MGYMLLEMQEQDAYLTQVAFLQLLYILDIFVFCISSKFEYLHEAQNWKSLFLPFDREWYII